MVKGCSAKASAQQFGRAVGIFSVVIAVVSLTWFESVPQKNILRTVDRHRNPSKQFKNDHPK